MTLATGSKLGPYEIVGQIGAGGMGEVYRAKDPRLGRDVAIKVLPASFSQDADRLRRFEQEAKAAGLLNHPEHHDRLRHRQRGRRAVRRPGAARGRDAARRARVRALRAAQGDRLRASSSRTVSPPRTTRASSTGTSSRRTCSSPPTAASRSSTSASPSSRRTRPAPGRRPNLPTATAGTEPGVVMGTLGYMSPEQIKGKPADARSDIFAFGAILYEMLAGRRAFHADSAGETMAAILKEEPPDLSVTNQSISPGPRAHRAPLHREEPGAALPVRPRPRLRPRGAVGDVGDVGRGGRGHGSFQQRAENRGDRGGRAPARGSGVLGRPASRSRREGGAAGQSRARDVPARQRPVRTVHGRRTERGLQRRVGGSAGGDLHGAPGKPRVATARHSGGEPSRGLVHRRARDPPEEDEPLRHRRRRDARARTARWWSAPSGPRRRSVRGLLAGWKSARRDSQAQGRSRARVPDRQDPLSDERRPGDGPCLARWGTNRLHRDRKRRSRRDPRRPVRKENGAQPQLDLHGQPRLEPVEQGALGRRPRPVPARPHDRWGSGGWTSPATGVWSPRSPTSRSSTTSPGTGAFSWSARSTPARSCSDPRQAGRSATSRGSRNRVSHASRPTERRCSSTKTEKAAGRTAPSIFGRPTVEPPCASATEERTISHRTASGR